MTESHAKGGCSHQPWGGWQSIACGKPIKDEGLCAGHLADKRRSETARANAIAAYDASETARQSALHVAKLLEIFEIAASPDYDYGRYTGKVTVDGTEVLRVLESLTKEVQS